MEFQIRPISGDEWRLWRSLRLRAVEESPDSFRGTLGRESAEANEWWSKLIETTVADPRGLLLVAEAGPDPIGMLFGLLDADNEVLDIGAMWVDPELRRQGVGTGLMDMAFIWGREAGVERAELWVTVGNQAAEEFYRDAGFGQTGETEPLRDGSDLTVTKLSVRI